MDGIVDMCIGLFMAAVGTGRINLHRNKHAMERFLKYYGKWFRVVGPLIVMMGVVKIVAYAWPR